MIIHQSQPCQQSCVSTCLAMIMDAPVAHVKQRFHARYWDAQESIATFLDELGIPFTLGNPLDRSGPKAKGVYLLTVPSLTTTGGLHQVLGVITQEGKWAILDPQAGNDTSYYSAAKVEEDFLSVAIYGYVVDAFISEADLVKWRNKQ